jgi:hypothetical protein
MGSGWFGSVSLYGCEGGFLSREAGVASPFPPARAAEEEGVKWEEALFRDFFSALGRPLLRDESGPKDNLLEERRPRTLGSEMPAMAF